LAQESVLSNIRQITATLAEQEKLVHTLARQMDAACQHLSELEERLASRRQEYEAYNKNLANAEQIESKYESWQELRVELERWEEVASQFREHEVHREDPLREIQSARARLEAELHTLQGVQKEIKSAESEISELQTQIGTVRESITQSETQLVHRSELEVELKTAHQLQAEARAENPRLKSEMEELKTRIDQLSQTEGVDCPVCGQPLSPTERQILIDELTTQGVGMGDRYRANLTLLNTADNQVRDLEKQIAELSQAETALRLHNKNFSQLSSRLDVLETQVNTWKTVDAPRLLEISTSLDKKTFATGAHASLAEIDAELKSIGYDAAAHDSTRLAEMDARSIEGEMRSLEKAKAALSPLKRELAGMEKQHQVRVEELAHQKGAHSEAVASLASAQAQAPDLGAAEKDLRTIQESENRLRLEVGAARQKVLVLEDLKERRAVIETQRAELLEQVRQYKLLERAFGKDGVPALLIEQALPQIESKANEILERLSQGDMSVRFITQARYKDSRREDLRETLDIQISDNAGTRDYEMFSGGEAFRINFAIRLALSEILTQRAGARLQTLVIDEGFGSQDALGRQRLIEAINLVRSDFAKILVITHINELKESFPNRIEVEKTARGSVVQVI
jgi:exonuclease SbcC